MIRQRSVGAASRGEVGVWAADVGADAFVGLRYDANEVAGGVTEVLAYATAVVVEPTA